MIFAEMIQGELKGCHVQKTPKGMFFYEMEEDELTILASFNNLLRLFEQGFTLQVYQDGHKFCADMGMHRYKGPYAKEDYLDIYYQVKDENMLAVLENLNNLANKKNKKAYIKAYRTYGQMMFK